MKRTLLFLIALAALVPASLRAAVPPAAGPDFQVNQIAGGDQSSADVAEDAAGDSVYVWLAQAPPTQIITARLFNPQGEPLGEDVNLGYDNQTLSKPHVAMTPQGEFVVVWSNPHSVILKRFDRLGRALGNGTVTQQPTPEPVGPTDVAIDAAGNVAVVWQVSRFDGEVIYVQRFNASNQAQTVPLPVNQNTTNGRTNPRVVFGADGSLLVSWDDFRTGNLPDVWARRFDGPTGTWSQEFRVNETSAGLQQGSAPILYPSGEGAVVYSDSGVGQVLVRQVSAAGAPVGNSIPLGTLGNGGGPGLDAALGPDGTVLAAWTATDLQVHARYFDLSWHPLTDDFLVSSTHDDAQLNPAVAANPSGGGFAVAWTSAGNPQSFPIPIPTIPNGRDGSMEGIFAQRFQDPLCAGGSETLCLNGGRFEVQVNWKNPYTGETGTGKALPLTGSDTGAFWFFGEENLELMVKVLDGRAVNGYFWVYYGSLSNVEYSITITDHSTGLVKTYRNAAFQLASRSDIRAFPGGPAAAAAKTAAPALLPPISAKDGDYEPAGSGDCPSLPNVLCLNQGRFQVQVDFTDPRNGAGGPAHPVPLTDDTGDFWFFSPVNLELMIKVLDGRPVNGAFWVFYGSLSDVEYTITVTDLLTQRQKTYHNARGHQSSGADTLAFPASN